MNNGRKIDIAVAGKFHAYYLAAEFASLYRLRDLYSSHRSLRPPKHVSKGAFHNRIDFAVWAALARFLPVGYSGDHKNELFDNWLSHKLIGKAPGILHSWNGNSHSTFTRLKGTGWLLCLERSCPHNQVQFDLLQEEGKMIDIPHVQNMRALDRAIEELYLADVIVAPSSYSARSYKDTELTRKVRVNPLGANFTYVDRPQRNHGLKVLMVGNDFLRKGAHYLVEAFRRVSIPKAELWIRGDVPDAYRKRIRDSRITIIPPLSPGRLRRLYRDADVFVQPSIDEGFGMTVFEALGFGLPLVVTENVGSGDLLSPDVAVTVPIRNPEALAAAIELARQLPGTEFDASRRRILEKNTWRACAQRMIHSVYLRA